MGDGQVETVTLHEVEQIEVGKVSSVIEIIVLGFEGGINLLDISIVNETPFNELLIKS